MLFLEIGLLIASATPVARETAGPSEVASTPVVAVAAKIAAASARAREARADAERLQAKLGETQVRARRNDETLAIARASLDKVCESLDRARFWMDMLGTRREAQRARDNAIAERTLEVQKEYALHSGSSWGSAGILFVDIGWATAKVALDCRPAMSGHPIAVGVCGVSIVCSLVEKYDAAQRFQERSNSHDDQEGHGGFAGDRGTEAARRSETHSTMKGGSSGSSRNAEPIDVPWGIGLRISISTPD